jgi:myo-inositol 2-dehydrogenase/D-chiro-inositol 1-dehydrogenase
MHSESSLFGAAPSSRRDFLKASTVLAGAAAGGLLAPQGVHAGESDTLKIGLIGCGGRGTGAASNAISADPNVRLTAMADMFPDRLDSSLNTLKQQVPASKIDVPAERRFYGFDGYKELIASDVDVVLLCTPPHFRPLQLAAAVEAGKHVFCEKPTAVDAPGVRSVLASAEQARQKKLSLVSGLCYRYDLPKRELMQRVHDGAIGDIVAMHVDYNTGTLWHHGRKPEWSEMEYQLRNWLYFTWLSGDFNVEQHVHSLDKAAWAMKDVPPLKATGLGGRQVRTEEQYGHIFDHMSVVYEYANGVKLFANCRQMAGCSLDVNDHLIGSKGSAQVMKAQIAGEQKWQYSGPKAPSMYVQEHQELFASIRSANPINNGQYMAQSTMMGIMGRMVCYTGQTLTWEQCLNSKEQLGPEKYELGAMPVPPIAKPGLTQFS